MYKPLYITAQKTNLNWLAGYLPSTFGFCMVSSIYISILSPKDTKGHLPQELQPVESAVARSAGESLEEELQVE